MDLNASTILSLSPLDLTHPPQSPVVSWEPLTQPSFLSNEVDIGQSDEDEPPLAEIDILRLMDERIDNLEEGMTKLLSKIRKLQSSILIVQIEHKKNLNAKKPRKIFKKSDFS